VLVIGIGNPDRGDDAIGPAVAGLVRREQACTGAEVITRSGDMLGLIEDWMRSDVAILIDAAAPRLQPGRTHRVDASSGALPHGLTLISDRASTHSFGVAEALELGAILHRLPARLVLYAVEGACFEPGSPMTPAVAAAAATVAQDVLRELRHR
jgi:hydrogenase maturation protease